VSDIARYIDHTNLKPDASKEDIEKLCREAIEHQFFSVCVSGSRIELAHHLLENCDVQVGTVVGFPHGAIDKDSKRYETELAIDLGADEIDMVMNIGRLKDRDTPYIVREIRDIVESAEGRIVKVILENCLLSNEEIRRACNLVMDAQAHFVKTSTGFSTGGATVKHIKLMRETVKRNAGVKASGGIRDFNTAKAMIEAGATRLGCSASVAIISGSESPMALSE
jgi:deoxyribose-phosphate aldolase